MSKSFGNVISLRASARDMFGKIMSIPDALIGKYFELLTDITPDPTLSPRDAKLLLARTIVAMYRGAKASKAAEDEFIRVFSKKELPHNLAEVYLSRSTMTIVDAVLEVGFAKSRSEARRLVVQGAVRINDFVQRNPNEFVSFSGGEIMRVGKRRFAKIQVGRQI
jgi:tyrosyl-tRNA synthetase